MRATVLTSNRHRHLDTSPRTASLAGAPAGEGTEGYGRGSGGMIRIALNTNIIDTILDNPGFLQEIHIAGTTDALILITNHPLHDEVSATTDADKRERPLAASEALPKKRSASPRGSLAYVSMGSGFVGKGFRLWSLRSRRSDKRGRKIERCSYDDNGFR